MTLSNGVAHPKLCPPLNLIISLSEPGYYEDGKFGIRIENVGIIKHADTPYRFDERGYLAFEHFTMVSILLSPACPRVSGTQHYTCNSVPFKPNSLISSCWQRQSASG